jgi:hypothetical protein
MSFVLISRFMVCVPISIIYRPSTKRCVFWFWVLLWIFLPFLRIRHVVRQIWENVACVTVPKSTSTTNPATGKLASIKRVIDVHESLLQ